MLTLAEYDKIALKLIRSYGRINGGLKITDELIGRVVRFMAKADHKWEKGKSKLNEEEYRRMYAICAIREYLKPAKRSFLPIHSNICNPDIAQTSDKNIAKVKFLVNNSNLTNKEQSVIDLFLADRDFGLIAQSLGITYNQCRKLYESAINKMKRISNVE